jgi:hypothetical protein
MVMKPLGSHIHYLYSKLENNLCCYYERLYDNFNAGVLNALLTDVSCGPRFFYNSVSCTM